MDLAKYLADSGYRCTSNRHHMVSRIDRPDWREHMARSHVHGFPGNSEKNFTEGMAWVSALGHRAGDHYRRVYSRDHLELHRAVFDRLKRITRGAEMNSYIELIEEQEKSIG